MDEQQLLTFSILVRIEPTATTRTEAISTHGSIFQYPRSDRANCNKLLRLLEQLILGIFQYPRSDRANCNIPRQSRQYREIRLSVSSFGSSQLQPGPRRYC